MSRKISDNRRARKAIQITNRILLSYFWLFVGKKLFGKGYYERRKGKFNTRNAERVKKGITDLQGLFIKVGQLLSMMSNILPIEYSAVLESLQDHAPPSPLSSTKKIIEEDLNDSIENIFADFDEEPIASASIGQVYQAKLKSGEKVAVKVQHKEVQELATADLEIIRKLISRVSFFIKINGIDFVYEQVSKMIEEELDFNRERESMVTIKANLSEIKGVDVPEVYAAYSSSRMITTSFQDAVKITNIEQLDAWQLKREDIARRLILAFCKMVLEDGFYHADPHPGNVFVKKDGTIILLDFGATAELNEQMRLEIPLLLQAAIRKDHNQVVISLQKMGFVGNDSNSRKVAMKIVESISQFLSNQVNVKNFNVNNISLEDVKGSSIDGLRKELNIKELTKSIQVPKDWVLLDRAIILVSGISAVLAPELDPIEVVKPYMKKQLLRGANLRKLLLDGIKQQFNAIFSLPNQLSTFLKNANNGDLEVQMKQDKTMIYAIGQQLILGIFIIASILFHYLSKQEFWLFIGGAVGFFLIRSVWKHGNRN